MNSISICARALTAAACCSVIAMNQPNDAVAPTKPTRSEGRQARAIRPSSGRSRHSIHTSIAVAWKTIVAASVTAACIMKLGPPSDSDAARYATAAMPNSVPDASPIAALRLAIDANRLRQLSFTRATEISMTPTTLMAIAASTPVVTLSPRNIRPKSAACAGSVRE